VFFIQEFCSILQSCIEPRRMFYNAKMRSDRSIAPGGMNSSVLLVVLWICFVLRGVFYCVALPLWEGYDEPYHFAAVQYVLESGHMPNSATPLSAEVEASLYLAPESWMIRLHSLPRPVITHDDYWKLPLPRREAMRRELSEVRVGTKATKPDPGIPNYESQQPPLFYFSAAALLNYLGRYSLQTQVIVLRIATFFLASLVVPICYLIALRVLGTPPRALLVVALMVVLPELLINLARVSNEAPAIVVASTVLLFSLKVADNDRPFVSLIMLGTVLGLGLLTKAYFLAFLPAVLIVILMLAVSRDNEKDKVLLSAAAVISLVVVIAGSWYWHVHSATGSWSGETNDAAASAIPKSVLAAQLFHVNWRSGIISILLSHIWFGAWSFLRLPTWMYVATSVFGAAGLTGSVVAILRRSPNRSHIRHLVVLLSFYLCFWMSLAYHILATYVHLGVSASTGWYLYCLVVGELLLIEAGYVYWSPTGFKDYYLALPVALFAGIDLYGMHSLLLPYYSGFIRHVQDKVAPLPLRDIGNLPIGQILTNVALVSPSGIGRVGFIALWVLYVAATTSVVIIAFYIAGISRILTSSGCGSTDACR